MKGKMRDLTIKGVTMADFESIRPINDSEVKETLDRLVNNPKLANTVIHFRFAKWPKWTYPLIALFLRNRLKKHALSIKNVNDFQHAVAPYMKRTIETTTKEFTVSGLERHDVDSPCLFISNHRDIALDPAFVNWSLYRDGNATIRIAIGDNLLAQNWISDIMRLNKSFIVNRSAKTKREKLTASKELSAYIHHSLRNEGEHIWIAQREGRAKDGNDLTNPALISMLALNKPKTQEFSDYLNELHVIPVSISYEYDPCDLIKAKELHQLEVAGVYEKEDSEDIESISKGISGFKGRVHVHFEAPLKNAASSRELAEMLDVSIQKHYKLFASNIAAAQMLDIDLGDYDHGFSVTELNHAKMQLQNRSRGEDAAVVAKLLSMYAAPVVNKLKHLKAGAN